jgi:geranylgeranyl diphosphate synthase type II
MKESLEVREAGRSMTLKEDLDRFLSAARKDVDAALDRYVPRPDGFGRRLFEAMRHSLFSGGKRLRPCLCLLVCESLGGARRAALPAACALEMVHTYSLIHDDLPAMDDDDLRRGRATCHKAFDEATAILAGDALLTLAFQTVAENAPSPGHATRITAILSRAAGPLGMVLGQMRDLESEGRPCSIDRIRDIHATKTAAMIAASFEIGSVAAGADEEVTRRLSEAGLGVGLAFQIVDDILDVTATTAQLGKTAGKDAAGGKATYPAAIGLDASRREAESRTEEALRLLPGGESFSLLHELVRKMLFRTH